MRKNLYSKILREESKEQHLSTVPKSCPKIKVIFSLEKHFASWWGTVMLGETCMCPGEGENWNVYFHLKVALRLFSWGICNKPMTRCS